MAKNVDISEKEEELEEQVSPEATEEGSSEAEIVEGEVLEDEAPLLTLEEYQEALAEAEAKAAENLDGWQRARAEFQNYKRRKEAQLEQSRQNAAANILSKFFPFIDDLELALQNLPEGGEEASWGEGIQLVFRKLLTVLESEGVTRIQAAAGQPFDPNFHEALTQEENDEFEEGTIIAVLRQGYQLDDQVLRAAQVRVAK